MKRRDVLKAASAGVGMVAVGVMASQAQPADTPESEPVDVLVIGGGTAGTIAAIQAARAGAKTVLVEMGSQLGGTTTTGGVAFPGLFHAWGKQIIAGIGWDLVRKTVELGSGTLPDFTTPPKHHWEHQIHINGQLYAALAEEACIEAGVTLCYYEFPLAIQAMPDGWQVDVAGKGIRRRVLAKQLVDCTGGADVVGMLGLERLREASIQPGTLIFRLGGYDVARLDRDQIQKRYLEAVRDGRLQPGDLANADMPFMHFLANGGANAQHVLGADSSTSATKTEANIAGRASLLRLLRFVRSLPGCENAQVLQMQQETGVRETYRIVGETQITHEDYTTGRAFDDAVSYSFYPIDLHTEAGVAPKALAQGVVPTVPLGALVPKGTRNLLVAGRSVSSDRLANSALRVQASSMAMGQAAGGAAALAARHGQTPRAVPLAELKSLLAQHGAIVP